MRRLVPAVVLAALLALPAAAGAGVTMVGSDLSEPAAATESHPRDWASWPTAFSGSGGPVTVPVEGEVTMVQFKGNVLRPGSAPYPQFDFMVSILRPQSDGTHRVIQTTEGQAIPYGGDSQQITTYDFASRNYNMCVEPGDVVSLITSGGFGPGPDYGNGYEVQMFAGTGSSALIESPRADGFFGQDNIGTAGTRTGELLMRSTIGSGDDASFTCRSSAQNQNPTVQFPVQEKEVPASGGKVAVQLRCASVRACSGTLYARFDGNVIGSGAYNLAGGDAGPVSITLSANGLRKLRERGGRLAITVQAKVSGGAQVEEGGFTVVGGGGSSGGGDSVATPVKPKAKLPVRKGKVTLTVRCAGSAACTGKLALSKVGTFFGSARFSVPGGSARAVAVKLNADAKRAIRTSKGSAISAKAVAKTASGAKSVIFKIKRA